MARGKMITAVNDDDTGQKEPYPDEDEAADDDEEY